MTQIAKHHLKRFVTVLYNRDTGEVKSVDAHGFDVKAAHNRARVTFLLHVGEEWEAIKTVTIPDDAPDSEYEAIVTRIVEHFNEEDAADLEQQHRDEMAAENAAVTYGESAHAWGDGSYLVDPYEAGDEFRHGLGEIDGEEQ